MNRLNKELEEKFFKIHDDITISYKTLKEIYRNSEKLDNTINDLKNTYEFTKKLNSTNMKESILKNLLKDMEELNIILIKNLKQL